MQPGSILALDLGVRLGWALGAPGTVPRCGVTSLKDKDGPAGNFERFMNWLDDQQQVNQPRSIVVEAPIDQHKSRAASLLAWGLIAHLMLFCRDRQIEYHEEHVGRTRKRVIGQGGFPAGTAKAEVRKWLVAQGWDVLDNNAADALVLWFDAEGLLLGRPAGALFQQRRAA